MPVPKASRKNSRPQNRQPWSLRPIGVIRSTLRKRSEAPKQGSEGAPDAWLEIQDFALSALDGIAPGDDLLILTWLHQSDRTVLKVHPRSDPSRRLTGVFATRSPDRPNPIGLHRVTVRKIEKHRLRIGPIEAIDGTPVVDIKPALFCLPAR
jgi:tRNA-Thr(GGU) m(6)t(6)A37 methyltransferase TsaA